MSRRTRHAARTDGAAPREPSRSRVHRAAILLTIVAGTAVLAGWWVLSPGKPGRLNLLLITIDTLRADHLGAYGSSAGATPVLDALASRGVRFDQVQTAAPLTAPSHATILTGQYPPSHGVRGNVVFTLGASHPTLATRLKARGYRTAAFVGAYPVAAAFGFAQGFDVFDEEFHETSPIDQGAERRANEVADAAMRWLAPDTGRENRQAPFFAWLHFYDPHAPYDPRNRSPNDSPVARTTGRSRSPTPRSDAFSRRCAPRATIRTPSSWCSRITARAWAIIAS